MFKHILIPTDGSELSTNAIEKGIKFAAGIGASVTGLNVVPNLKLLDYQLQILEETRQTLNEAAKSRSLAILEVLSKAAKAANVECKTEMAVNDRPYRAIIDSAEKNGCDLILMASHGRSGVSAVLLGSETHRVLTHSKIPVLVLR
ncbi:MAG TPA: universal stress protein [Dokdonella sp.]|uniref:universal stress protein n=1 Tax=Dokdonella sp. TaxID=2291710 RepID=UPI002D807ECB|nr:universal stress protein [Dokdonella sp.]HET9032541.1 universal stress protein [Dokdonella sp.]